MVTVQDSGNEVAGAEESQGATQGDHWLLPVPLTFCTPGHDLSLLLSTDSPVGVELGMLILWRTSAPYLESQ